MRRIFFVPVFLVCASVLAAAHTFTADTRLVVQPTEKQKSSFYTKNPPPVLAVYQKEGHMLVVLAAKHSPQSLPFVQYAFDTYAPQIALIEREPVFPLSGRDCREMEDAYTAALSAKNNIPLVRNDLDLEHQWQYAKKDGFSYEDFQMFWIIRNAYGFAKYEGKQTSAAQEISDYKRALHNPSWGELFTEERLLAYFKQHYGQNFNSTDFIQLYMDLMEVSPKKWVKKTPFYKIMHTPRDRRSEFMLQNITAALNEYDIVFSEMGAGHFVAIQKALKKRLGKPRYIQATQLPQQPLWQDCSLDGLREKQFL